MNLSSVTKEYLKTYQSILEEMIRNMTTVSLTDSISHNFIVQMIPHHRAAIEMSRNILRFTTCIPLENIACGIIEEQTKSIEDMCKIKSGCAVYFNSSQDVEKYQCRVDQIMQTMFTEMGNAPSTNQINADFMREMIPHHEGAIRLSKTTLKYSVCPELRPILRAIISSQEKGVAKMQRLLCHTRC